MRLRAEAALGLVYTANVGVAPGACLVGVRITVSVDRAVCLAGTAIVRRSGL